MFTVEATCPPFNKKLHFRIFLEVYKTIFKQWMGFVSRVFLAVYFNLETANYMKLGQAKVYSLVAPKLASLCNTRMILSS